MTATSRHNLTTFPPFGNPDHDPTHSSGKHDSPLDSPSEMMASETYIKPEPNDFNNFDPNRYAQFNQGPQSMGGSNNPMINPASLSNGMSQPQNYGQPSMSSSFNMGNSGIADDELLDLEFGGPSNQQGNFDFSNSGIPPNMMNQQAMNQQNMFSHTPDGAPIQSPFTPDSYHYSQFRPSVGQQFPTPHSLPNQTGGFRPHMQMDRKLSENGRSPATPNTPGMTNLHMHDDFQHPGVPQKIQHHRQQGSMGGWESTPSHHSWNESSPFPSPANGHPIHSQISEVLKTDNGNMPGHKVASSLPIKMENGPAPAFQTQEAKRRRRRESHNMVERRRRDNINERIQDLGTLVPQHRLDDEKVRKHLQTNAPLSPSITNSGMSPPNAATSLLAGPQGRRATATSAGITQGLPQDDKDKGPNKGDILNGSVAWTRDLMWYMYKKLRQEEQLKELVAQLGGVWPFDQPPEEELRMHSEICEILNKHAPQGGFAGYSRAPGSGLRVPGYTNVAGDSISGADAAAGGVSHNGFASNGQPASPGLQSGGSGVSSGQISATNPYWNADFKEEDEYVMEMQ